MTKMSDHFFSVQKSEQVFYNGGQMIAFPFRWNGSSTLKVVIFHLFKKELIIDLAQKAWK